MRGGRGKAAGENGDGTLVDPAAADAGSEPLRVCVERSLRQYFETLDGESPHELYELVLAEVEGPLLRVVMEVTGGNQSRAAEFLGLNRGTLRKKLDQYGLL